MFSAKFNHFNRISLVSSPTPTPTITLTPTNTVTPTVTPTNTITPTSSAIPATPAITVTPTKTPTPTQAGSFTPVAFVVTTGTSRSVPTGATSMKAWVIGGGGGGAYDTQGCGLESDGGYGGESVRTYSVSGGTTITYIVGAGGLKGDGGADNGGNTTLTYGGVTITATGGAGGSENNGTGSGGDFNRSFLAGGVLDFQGRVAAVTLSGSSLNAGFKGTAGGGAPNSATNGSPGGIVLYFT